PGDYPAQSVPADVGAPVQLGPAQRPAQPEDSCNTADCPANGDRAETQGARHKSAVLIGKPAQRAIQESHEWVENPAAIPFRDSGGRVVFPFSESAPTVVCTTYTLCDIELQPGELVQGAPHIGDSIRWKVSPAVSGSEDHKVTHLIVKPTEVGL